MTDLRTSVSVDRWRLEQSVEAESIWLVFGDGKYLHDPPRVASALEAALIERLLAEEGFVMDDGAREREYDRLHTCATCHQHPADGDDARLGGFENELLFCSQACEDKYESEVDHE